MLQVFTSDALPGAGFHLVRARIEREDAQTSEGWGRDTDARLAQVKAVAEAVERADYQRLPASAFIAASCELQSFLDPRNLVRYRLAQFAYPQFPFAPFDPGQARWWLPASPVLGGPDTHAVADCVCSPRAFTADYRQALLTGVSSSGCATASRIEDAIERAALELLERDAFMRHWLAQVPGLEVRADTLPAAAAARIRRLMDAGCRAGVQCLVRGMHPTWFAWAQHEGLHFTCVGAGSGVDAAPALESALNELDTIALARLAGVPAEAIREEDVRRPAEHGALYATSGYFHRADRLLRDGECVAYAEVAASFSLPREALYANLQQAGHPLHWVDLSGKAPRVMLEGQPLHTVRVLAPGLIPIAFGYRRLPLGMVREYAAGCEAVHPFA